MREEVDARADVFEGLASELVGEFGHGVAYGEQRFRALGFVDDDFFMVAYTWRGESRRIISAWKADDDGKRRYAAILARKP